MKLPPEIRGPLFGRDTPARGCSPQVPGKKTVAGFHKQLVRRNEKFHNEVFHSEVLHNEVFHSEVFHSEAFHSEAFHNGVFHNEAVEVCNEFDEVAHSWRGGRDDGDGLEEAGGCRRGSHPRCCSRHSRNLVLDGGDEPEGLVERDDVVVDADGVAVDEVFDIRGRRSREEPCGESQELVCSEPEVKEESGWEPLCNGAIRTRCNRGPAFVVVLCDDVHDVHGDVEGREVFGEDLEVSRGSGLDLERRMLEG